MLLIQTFPRPDVSRQRDAQFRVSNTWTFMRFVGDGQRIRKSHLTRGGEGESAPRKWALPLPFGIIIRQPLKYPVYDDRRGNFACEASRAGHQKPPLKLSAPGLLNFQNFPSRHSKRLLIRGYILMRPACIIRMMNFMWKFYAWANFRNRNDSGLFSPFFFKSWQRKRERDSVAKDVNICIREGKCKIWSMNELIFESYRNDSGFFLFFIC